MTKRARSFVISLVVIVLLLIAARYFVFSFFRAFAPPKITVTKNYITTDRYFANGVKIEKIRVDSIGDKGYPVKYQTLYTTSCNIKHPKNKPPDPPDKIEFYKPGKYFWDEDTTKVKYIHNGLSRQPSGTTSEVWWLNSFGNYPTCPIKFESEQWYFITIGDPQVTGIFFYIDILGNEHQHFLASGVSPI